jgi:O-6-methylguanine DNA methyltransferase
MKGVLFMKQAAYCLFETPLGACGIAWKEQETSRVPPVVTFFQLPEATRSLTDTRIAGSSGGRKARVPPPRIAGIIKKVQKHLHGDVQDFLDIVVDLDGAGPFARQVYEAVRKIPAGRTVTYGDLAKDMNRPTAARAVGQALGRNPIPLIIPCHRVLAARGKAGGFSAHGGLETKEKMLGIEGVTGSSTSRCRLQAPPWPRSTSRYHSMLKRTKKAPSQPAGEGGA